MFQGVIGASWVCWQSMVFTLLLFTTTESYPIFEACNFSCDFLRFLLQKISSSSSMTSKVSIFSSCLVLSPSLGELMLGSLSEKLKGLVSTLLSIGRCISSSVFLLVMRSLMMVALESKRSRSANNLSLSSLTGSGRVFVWHFYKQRLRSISLLLYQRESSISLANL